MKLTTLFAILCVAGMCGWIYYNYPHNGEYTETQRNSMNAIYASAEYEARKADLLNNVTPLSVADLEIK